MTHSETVRRALRLAADAAAENAVTMRGCAAALRAGGPVPPFAFGEAGAIAADALAADHERFAADCRRELASAMVVDPQVVSTGGLSVLVAEFAYAYGGAEAQYVVLVSEDSPVTVEQLRALLDPGGEYRRLEFGFTHHGPLSGLKVLP